MTSQSETETVSPEPITYSEIFGVTPMDNPDIESHVRVVECDGEVWVEQRDFIKSLGEYGRGYKVPLKEAMDHGMYLQLAAASRLDVELP